MTAPAVQRLQAPLFLFREGPTARGVPDWFVDWVRLGTLAAEGTLSGTTGAQTVIAISTPAKALTSAAIAFGFTRHRYVRSGRLACPPHLAASLSDVRPGMRIWLRMPEHVVVGTYLAGLPERIRLSTAGQFLASKVVEVRRVPEWAAIPDHRATDIAAGSDVPFAASMLPGSDPEDFLTAWDWGLVLVGSRGRFSDESSERISTNSPTHHFGAIRTIVRPFEEFAPIGWRSVAMSSRADEPVWSNFPAPPPLVILDGAYAVSRWLPECQAPLVIAVLDRTEPGVDMAVSALMQERSYAIPIRRSELSWRPPGGCELLGYRRRS